MALKALMLLVIFSARLVLGAPTTAGRTSIHVAEDDAALFGVTTIPAPPSTTTLLSLPNPSATLSPILGVGTLGEGNLLEADVPEKTRSAFSARGHECHHGCSGDPSNGNPDQNFDEPPGNLLIGDIKSGLSKAVSKFLD